MQTTRYFREKVLLQRPYIKAEWCQKAIMLPINKVVQLDGRVKHWIFVAEYGKYLRVVTLSDGITVHNAFFDRGFKE